jgi:RimJ/RimL family protein N-acetyltransferase
VTKIIEFETERLLLRQWREMDFLPFAEMNADSRVMAYFPSTLNEVVSNEMANKCKTLIASRGWGFWATELKATKEFIGFVGLHIPSLELPISPCVEIGWRLAFDFWGKGLASEAATGALKIGFGKLSFSEIVAFTSLGNRRSRAVMERIGMIETGRQFEHPSVPDDSPHRRHCLYNMTRKGWSNTVQPFTITK